MRPLIQTEADSVRLRTIALSWLGTPWTADGAVKGTGVSCSTLPWAILHEFGHAAPAVPSRRTILKRDILVAIQSFLNAHPEHYLAVEQKDAAPGDILLIYAGIGHAALVLGGCEMIHCWQKGGVHRSTFADQKFATRIVGVWRPVVS
jgi:cell wall-associated NlpC family hydrolase